MKPPPLAARAVAALGAGRCRRHVVLGVGAGVGRFEIDDIAQEDLSVVQLVAPDDDGLEGQRALAQARDHRLAAGLDALGDRDFALAGEQLDRAHFAQIHPHRIVGALGRLGLLGFGGNLVGDRNQLAVGLVVVVGLFGRLVLFFLLGLVGIDDVDAHFVEHRVDVLDLVGGHLFGGQHGVELVVGDVAALLGLLDHLLDRGVRQGRAAAAGYPGWSPEPPSRPPGRRPSSFRPPWPHS